MENIIEFENPDIPVIQGTSEMPDLEQFEGARVTIAGWEKIKMKSFFSPETNEKLEIPQEVMKLKVITRPLASGKRTDGTEFPITATALFSLKKDSKTNDWGISSHPKSNIQKFFKKLKVNSLNEIKDKYVTVTIDGDWLRIVH